MKKPLVYLLLCSALLACQTQADLSATNPQANLDSKQASASAMPQSIPSPSASQQKEAVKTLVPFQNILPTSEIYNTLSADKLVASFNELGIRLIQKLQQQAPQQNILIAPQLIGTALVELYNLASPEVKIGISDLLGLDEATLKSEFENYSRLYFYRNKGKGLKHSLWLSDDLHLTPEEIQQFQNWGLEIFQADFKQAETTQAMNAWMGDSFSGIQPGSGSVLLSADHLEDTWWVPFDKELTEKLPFYLANGQTVMVDTLVAYDNKTPSYHYSNPEGIEVLSKSAGFSIMNWYLPASNSSLSAHLQSLNYAKLLKLRSNDHLLPTEEAKTNGDLRVPKLNLEQSKDLKSILQALEFKSPEDVLTLQRLFSQPTGIARADVYDRFELNEIGISTSSGSRIWPLASFTDPFDFNANRPFFFTLESKSYGEEVSSIYYIGVVNDPTKP